MKRGDQHRPGEQRHARQGHPGARMLQDGRDEDHRGGERGDFGEGNHLRPDIGALSGENSGPESGV